MRQLPILTGKRVALSEMEEKKWLVFGLHRSPHLENPFADLIQFALIHLLAVQ